MSFFPTTSNTARILFILAVLLAAGCTTEPEPGVLLDAAEKGDLARLTQMLEKTRHVDERDACLFTPLMKASLNGHADAVHRLLLAGADVHATDKGGYTALMLAASNNHAAIVEELIAAGAAINQVETTNGWTALIWAANRGQRDSVKVLLAHGANREPRDSEGLTAADWARRTGAASITALFDGSAGAP